MTEILLRLALELVLCFIATIGFAIICNVSRRVLVHCGVIGTAGYLSYWIFMRIWANMPLASLLGSIVVAILSNRMSRYCKMPVTVFNIPGMVPLVPGGMAYEAIRAVVEGDYTRFMSTGVDTLMVAGAIALGLVLAEAFNNSIRSFVYRFRRIV